MSESYRLQGGYTISPQSTPASGCPNVQVTLDESVTLDKQMFTEIDLDVDTAIAVDFGGLTNAHVIAIHSNRKVAVAFTSADGTSQIIPVENFLKIISKGTVPYTAITLTRVAGQETKVKVFLGSK